jgi:hypothetical protein
MYVSEVGFSGFFFNFQDFLENAKFAENMLSRLDKPPNEIFLMQARQFWYCKPCWQI